MTRMANEPAAFYLTTEEVATVLSCSIRTVQKLIASKQLAALRLSDKAFRIPRPALASFIAGHTTGSADVPPVLRADPRDLEARLHGFEAEFGLSTKEFLAAYRADAENEQWNSRHHRWAALAETLESASVA